MSLLLVAVLIFALAACGGEETTTAATTDISEGTSGTTAATEGPAAEMDENGEYPIQLPLSNEPVTVTAFGRAITPGTGMVTNNDSTARQELEKRTNLHIEWTHPVSGQEQTQFNLMIASQEYQDFIINTPTYWIGGYDKYIDQDIIRDLTPYVGYMQNYMKVRAVDEDCILATMTGKGRIAFWRDINMTPQGTFQGTIVRKDWADELNIDLDSIKTYDDYYDTLIAFRDAGLAEDYLGYINCGTKNGMMGDLMLGYNMTTRNDMFYQIDGTMHYALYDGQNLYDYLTMMRKWYDEGILDRDFFTRTSSDKDSLYLNNRTGMCNTTFIDIDRYDIQTKDAENPDWTPVALPVKNEGDKRVLVAAAGLEWVTNSDVTISTAATEEEVKLICLYQDYLFTEEGALLRNYGTEGLSFYFDDEGKPRFNEFMTNNEDGYSLSQMMRLHTIPHGTVAAWYDWTRELAPNLSDKVKVETFETWDYNLEYQSQPVPTLAEEHYTEFSQKISDIKTYGEEWIVKAITGQIPLNEQTYEEYCEQLRSMGIEDCIKWQQEALEAYYERDITTGYTEEQLELYGLTGETAED